MGASSRGLWQLLCSLKHPELPRANPGEGKGDLVGFPWLLGIVPLAVGVCEGPLLN